ncbi:MAG: CbiX/SirB N-terminal domain-containing protein [Desulfobacter sp.]|nr:MAG: CbiX/SirB N-terminal domain-containing protein [Desulfobacter sp.]
MKALVIAAHGSRKKESAVEVAALTEKLAKKAKPEFDLVVHGFLQFSEPFLPGVVEDAVNKGADQVVIFPFFISAGAHIMTDIPELVRACEEKYPGTAFILTRHLGAVQGIEDIILDEVSRG